MEKKSLSPQALAALEKANQYLLTRSDGGKCKC